MVADPWGDRMPITKSDLIDQLAEKLQIQRAKAEQFVNVMFDSMVEALQRGDRIEIRGFGSFEVRHYKGYEGRNPRTGETVDVKPKRLPFFKCGKELRERVNKGKGPLAPDDDDPDVVDNPDDDDDDN
jgi:integration host factor subunit beta